ncbi:hypothetical protein ATANTOWER_007196 [Ataeniobius toweri]|uniref:Uncharacterized protein n=1 Tax=Ataeniobius toweri TaxID=208326 RepID=A0ABU7AE11_9TELE|nr:hypothetical protein [Ataeniobius toweri]
MMMLLSKYLPDKFCFFYSATIPPQGITSMPGCFHVFVTFHRIFLYINHQFEPCCRVKLRHKSQRNIKGNTGRVTGTTKGNDGHENRKSNGRIRQRTMRKKELMLEEICRSHGTPV